MLEQEYSTQATPSCITDTNPSKDCIQTSFSCYIPIAYYTHYKLYSIVTMATLANTCISSIATMATLANISSIGTMDTLVIRKLHSQSTNLRPDSQSKSSVKYRLYCHWSQFGHSTNYRPCNHQKRYGHQSNNRQLVGAPFINFLLRYIPESIESRRISCWNDGLGKQFVKQFLILLIS